MEDAVLPENPLFDRKMMIQELIKGRESASKLRNLLQKFPFNRQEDLPGVFINQILSSLGIVLEFLNSSGEEEIPEIKDAGDIKSNDSNPKRKNSAVGNDQRRNNRRRKQENTRIIWTETPLNDGQAWRKYGQKVIQNAKYPRCYFRCTHKYDKNCPAVKQVQRDEEDNSKYKVIYMEEHTCGIQNEMQQTQSNSSAKHQCILNFHPQDAKSMEENSVSHFFVQLDHNSQNARSNSDDDADGSDIGVENFLPWNIQSEWDYSMLSTGSNSGDMISRVCSPTFDDVFSFDQTI